MWLQHCSSSHQTNSDFIIQRLQHYGTALLVVKLTQTSIVHDCRSTTCTTVVPYHLIFFFFTLKIQLKYKAVNSFMLSMLYSNRESSIVGKDVTPFVLQRVNELTKGQSLQASILPLYNRFTCISFSIVALGRRFAWNETSFIRTDS